MTTVVNELQKLLAGPANLTTDEAVAVAVAIALLNDQAAQPSQARKFNRAINFAIKQGLGCSDFLRAWREGDTSEWPEFSSITTINTKELK